MRNKNLFETISFILLEIIFVIIIWYFIPEKSIIELFTIGFGASFIGRAIAYLKVFEWLRSPFCEVVPHHSGEGNTVEPKSNLKLPFSIIAELLSCHVCAGTWGALILFILPIRFAQVFAVACFAWLIGNLTTNLEWSAAKNWHDAAHTIKKINGKED